MIAWTSPRTTELFHKRRDFERLADVGRIAHERRRLRGETCAPALSLGTVVVQPSLEQMTQRSDTIIHAVVEDQSVTLGEDGKRILTVQFVTTAGLLGPAGDVGSPDPPLSITVAMNWAASMKK